MKRELTSTAAVTGSTLSARGRAAVTRRRVYRAVFDDIRQRIRRGDWPPGARLPSITQLAQDLHVGTGSVREALQSLQSVGLVKIEHGRGVFVESARPSAVLSRYFQDLGVGQIVALAETRRILEPELAALAAERGTSEQLAEIKDLAAQMEEYARLGRDFAEMDVRFHRSIAHAARNPILVQTIEGISDLFLQYRRMIDLGQAAEQRTAHFHQLIAEALLSRNPIQARLLMQMHMSDMLNDVMVAEAKTHLAD